MKIYTKLILLFLTCIAYEHTTAQSVHKLLRDGDKAYLKGDFKKAEQNYSAANEKKGDFVSRFNLGNSQYQQKNFVDATKSYQNALGSATTPSDKTNIYFNIGNAAYEQKQYQQAVDAYKKALKHNPSDLGTKENLTLAKHALRQQQKQDNQDKKDQKDQQNKDNQQQDQNKDNDKDNEKDKEQNEKDQQKNEQDQKIDDQNQEKQTKEEQTKEEQKSNSNEMSRKEAKELLDVIENEEKKVHQKLRRIDGKNTKPKKDW